MTYAKRCFLPITSQLPFPHRPFLFRNPLCTIHPRRFPNHRSKAQEPEIKAYEVVTNRYDEHRRRRARRDGRTNDDGEVGNISEDIYQQLQLFVELFGDLAQQVSAEQNRVASLRARAVKYANAPAGEPSQKILDDATLLVRGCSQVEMASENAHKMLKEASEKIDQVALLLPAPVLFEAATATLEAAEVAVKGKMEAEGARIQASVAVAQVQAAQDQSISPARGCAGAAQAAQKVETAASNVYLGICDAKYYVNIAARKAKAASDLVKQDMAQEANETSTAVTEASTSHNNRSASIDSDP
eukprot:gnl/MRDRNA2_/MRDRNA2_16335_c0_seq1.p1 gnl/MRDRNA2_/MRDRNA2_16335_c0~~gnl/MRDRNA2_/MRDRNA2_16335_c0_seq1.p1  ORF type:complete len:308 (-),score=38.38 gnl/MRDRNA2_/MRDRNA2_16335_c0_seq1:27-929(-)